MLIVCVEGAPIRPVGVGKRGKTIGHRQWAETLYAHSFVFESLFNLHILITRAVISKYMKYFSYKINSFHNKYNIHIE